MAKVKSSGLRNYVGRLAGNVYYINKGQNIARELAPQVSNPRTESQMDQRIKLANVVAMYRLNADWMKDHAFPNRPQNQSVYNAFVAANLAGSEVAMTKEHTAAGYCVVAPYDVTKGSLPRVQMMEDAEELNYAPSSLKLVSDDWSVGQTVATLSAELIENNSYLLEGDQISIICNYQYDDMGGIRAIVRTFEITLDLSDDTPITDVDFYHVLTTETINGVVYLAIDYYVLDEQAGSEYCGVAVIVSRKTSSGIQVSPATLALYGDTTLYDTMTSEARKRAARNSYGVSAEPFLVPGYGEGGATPVADVVTITAVNTIQEGGELTLNAQGVFNVRFGESHTPGAPCVVTITPKGGLAVTVNSTVTDFGDSCTGQEATLSNADIASVSVTVNGSEPATITFA